VIGVSPAFGVKIHRTTAGLPLSNVLRRLMAGISEAGGKPRVVRMAHTADTSFLGLSAARLAGSGIGIGIQAKGTTVIHKSDLAPHMNLELFSMAPLITEADYQAIGRNAALYALNHDPEPIVVPYGGEALGARFHVRTALLHALDTEMTEPEAEPWDLEVRFHDA
jgi:propanediol dehydratase large subunit